MPQRFAKPCAHPGCGVLVRGKGSRCAKHANVNVNLFATKRTVKSDALTKERRRLFAEHPLCAKCLETGRVTLATERDHIVPLADGGADEEGNTQALCHSCHVAKTLSEQTQRRASKPDSE